MVQASKSLIDSIASNFKTCVFLSPHLDDAAFSAGDLLLSLRAKGIPCVVITFFTQSHSQLPTLSARAFLSQSKSPVAFELFKNRREEDLQIFERLGIEAIHFPFVDAMWRTNPRPTLPNKLLSLLLPEFIHFYPTYRWHIKHGFMHPQDDTPSTLASILSSLSTKYPNPLFLAPVGTGSHSDHLFVREAASASSLPVLFWNDYPYSLHAKPPDDFIKNHDLHPHLFSNSWEQKVDLILQYKTQVSAIFPQGVPKTGEEIYYLPPAIEKLFFQTR